ncbi:MAG: fumarylacetoacetate hydrolase family protein [Pseudomonadota bacterium]
MNRAEKIAEKLAADWQARSNYVRLTGDVAPGGIQEAYAVQGHLQRHMMPKRGPIGGRKIALSSKAMQEMVNLDRPVAGAIFANDIQRSPAKVAVADFIHLGLEYELAFELAEELAPTDVPIGEENVLDLISTVRPAFELIDDKNADYTDICGLTLAADNAWCGGVVLGAPIKDWRRLNLGDLPSVLVQAGHPPEAGNTGAANPVQSLAWVLAHFASQGETLKAGEQIITGSVLRTRFPESGDRVRYEITGHSSVEIEIV